MEKYMIPFAILYFATVECGMMMHRSYGISLQQRSKKEAKKAKKIKEWLDAPVESANDVLNLEI